MNNTKISILSEIFGAGRLQGKEILFKCPRCGKPKLSISLEKNVYKCWTCQYPFQGKKISRLIRSFGSFLDRQKWDSLSGEVDLSQSL